jgi:hypothetical protein
VPTFLKDTVAIVDGTEVRITRSSDPTKERASYSLSEKKVTLTDLITHLSTT